MITNECEQCLREQRTIIPVETAACTVLKFCTQWLFMITNEREPCLREQRTVIPVETAACTVLKFCTEAALAQLAKTLNSKTVYVNTTSVFSIPSIS